MMWVFFLQKNTKLPFAITIIDQKKHKIKQIYIDTLLLCKQRFKSSVWNFFLWGADIFPANCPVLPSGEEWEKKTVFAG